MPKPAENNAGTLPRLNAGLPLPPMNRTISLILLSIGTVLVIYGLNALDSVSSSFSRLFTGAPTDKTIWLLISGVLCFSIGAGGVAFGRKASWDRS